MIANYFLGKILEETKDYWLSMIHSDKRSPSIDFLRKKNKKKSPRFTSKTKKVWKFGHAI